MKTKVLTRELKRQIRLFVGRIDDINFLNKVVSWSTYHRDKSDYTLRCVEKRRKELNKRKSNDTS